MTHPYITTTYETLGLIALMLVFCAWALWRDREVQIMSNMGYCRFRNTLTDFRDCLEAIESGEELSPEEQKAAKKLFEAAKDYIEAWEFNN